MRIKYRIAGVMIGAVVAQLVLGGLASASSLSTTTLATPGLGGRGANDYLHPSSPNGMSADGRLTVFSSDATNLVAGDTNNMHDVFIYDRVAKKTELISRNTAGQPANYASYTPTISGDGRYVAYATMASDIVPGTVAFCGGVICPNIVVYDRTTKVTVLANRTPGGQRIRTNLQTIAGDPPVISSDGRFVTYESPASLNANDTNESDDIFVYNLQAHTTQVASVNASGHTGIYGAYGGSISGDGRYVVFGLYPPLVPGDNNNAYDAYLHDMQTGVTTLLSTTPDGRAGNDSSFGPAISTDGHSVVFLSYASNLVAGDTNNQIDTFSRDLRTGKVRRVSVSSKHQQANGGSYDPAISGDGRFIIFSSWADNLVLNDINGMYDIFLYDRDSELVRLITRVSRDGQPASGGNLGTWQQACISGDGKAIAFTSDATNLTTIPLTAGVPNMYINYNPVVTIPYYDNNDYLDLLP